MRGKDQEKHDVVAFRRPCSPLESSLSEQVDGSVFRRSFIRNESKMMESFVDVNLQSDFVLYIVLVHLQESVDQIFGVDLQLEENRTRTPHSYLSTCTFSPPSSVISLCFLYLELDLPSPIVRGRTTQNRPKPCRLQTLLQPSSISPRLYSKKPRMTAAI